jgi:hypothetical protein
LLIVAIVSPPLDYTTGRHYARPRAGSRRTGV